MSNWTEGRRVITVGEEITRVNIIDEGKAVEIFFKVSESDKKKSKAGELKVGSQEFEKMFPIVDIEGLSLEEGFMHYEPKTANEKRVKASLIKAKKIGLKNFRIPAMDPAFDDDGETIIYCAGRKPAVGKSPKWWDENAPKFMPSKNSRLKDDLQADVDLGVMRIKYLIEEKGYNVAEAWKAVCVDSRDLGHYWNSENAKHTLEATGSRQIGKCFDLGNTFKIVKKSGTSGFTFFGGHSNTYSHIYPLAQAYSGYNPSNIDDGSVGEIVLDV